MLRSCSGVRHLSSFMSLFSTDLRPVTVFLWWHFFDIRFSFKLDWLMFECWFNRDRWESNFNMCQIILMEKGCWWTFALKTKRRCLFVQCERCHIVPLLVSCVQMSLSWLHAVILFLHRVASPSCWSKECWRSISNSSSTSFRPTGKSSTTRRETERDSLKEKRRTQRTVGTNRVYGPGLRPGTETCGAGSEPEMMSWFNI